jgi:putative zinc finger protein
MSDRRIDCARVRELAPEFVLGVAPGDERALILDHVNSCEECRRVIQEMSAVADELLLLAPDHEPPLGFENSVVRKLSSARAGKPRRQWLLTAAAGLVALSVGASAVWFATGSDRRVGAYYRSVLARADGEYFTARELWDNEGKRAGVVFAYEGDPSWLFMVVDGERAEGEFTCYAELEGGRSMALGTFSLGADHRTWGVTVDEEIHNLDRVRLDGSSEDLVATFADG